MQQLPAVVVLGLAGLALALGALVDWRSGAFLLAVALLLGAALRLSLPPRAAGWLVVRTRGTDAACLLVLGFGVAVLANTIPDA